MARAVEAMFEITGSESSGLSRKCAVFSSFDLRGRPLIFFCFVCPCDFRVHENDFHYVLHKRLFNGGRYVELL